MSTFAPQRPRHTFAARRNLAIVSSQFNQEFVQGLVNAARKEIETIAPKSNVTQYEVPGANEIPVVVQEVAAKGGFDAIIALGVIIRGETAHADLIGHSITEALQTIALRFRIPVIHEVLLVDNEAQARARSLGETQNRGLDAARAALQVAAVMDEVKGK
jgi:6,7-dimethyl-8-ribityllumazine synthase